MFILLLFSIAFGQTGGESTLMPEQPDSVKQWCLTNAFLKDQLVRKGGCYFEQQDKAFALPTISGKRYVCKKYPDGKAPFGYEGKLSCPDPLTPGGKPFVYQCATCITSNNTTGVPDMECFDSMKSTEEGLCQTDAGQFQYEHTLLGLQQIPGGPVPTATMQNSTETPVVP